MIKQNIERIKSKIAAVCGAKNINPASIRLVAVTKTVPAGIINEAIENGIAEIGENRVQEAESKSAELPRNRPVLKHLIGHLQTNKARKAVSLFDVIQSIDSLKIALEIDKEAKKSGKIQECLVEIKISGETTKYGCGPGELNPLVENILRLENIKLCGLMTIAPFLEDSEKTRPYFRRVKELFDKTKSEFPEIKPHFSVLSMGMTDDFKVAIEEGANMVRIGRAIFGDRNA